MASRERDSANVSLAELQDLGRPPTSAPTLPEPSRSASAVPDRAVYRTAVDALLPRLVRISGAAPWLSEALRDRRVGRMSAPLMCKQQAAAAAIGLTSELGDDRPDREYLRQIVRAALTNWQLSLRYDGKPAHRHSRRSSLHGVIASTITQLLNETTVFQTDLLLKDIEQHLHWLVRRQRQTPWIEAATVCALADGAVLVRDASLLKEARQRLDALCRQQDEEGWFPERGGADIGRLSLTIDALARTYVQNGWDELAEPLARALRFLIHFVHPDGTTGGCYSSCGTAFVSPYGVELLASRFSGAAALAAACRRRYQLLSENRFDGWHDNLCATVGIGLVQTAVTATPRLPDPTYPHESRGNINFPNAGISIFSTDAYHAVVGARSGGAMHVTWRSNYVGLDEPGVSVVSRLGTRTAGRWDRRTKVCATSSSVMSYGILRRAGTRQRRRRSRIMKWLRRNSSATPVRRDCSDDLHRDSDLAKRKRLGRDRYQREITLGDETIRIRDIIRCRLSCRTIICRSPFSPHAWRFVDRDGTGRSDHGPIFVDGGKYVEITRTYRSGKLVDHYSEPT